MSNGFRVSGGCSVHEYKSPQVTAEMRLRLQIFPWRIPLVLTIKPGLAIHYVPLCPIAIYYRPTNSQSHPAKPVQHCVISREQMAVAHLTNAGDVSLKGTQLLTYLAWCRH
ncbi:hypothetical protein BaRGS_00013554 [Batillaria attramentaria]|uniref:Uncharacterized protein n=1 Tax=Batillaria attramentaria TaxID=370345 RepID=A0ABD0L7R9_9CAEN